MPGPGKPFEKGWKGGPGRKKGSGRVQICKAWANQEGFQRLIEIASGKFRDAKTGQIKPAGWAPHPLSAKTLIWIGPSLELQYEALKHVLAYGCGKPTQFVDISSGGQSVAEWALEWFGANGHRSNGDGPNGNGPNGDGGLHQVSGEDS